MSHETAAPRAARSSPADRGRRAAVKSRLAKLLHVGAGSLFLILAPGMLPLADDSEQCGMIAAARADTLPPNGGEGDADEADFVDDGSRLLGSSRRRDTAEDLRPISPAEEKNLLGDWGDSAGEAED